MDPPKLHAKAGRAAAIASAARRPEWAKSTPSEARGASSLSHPNIATIYEVAESEGTHFIAMELVEGETLRAMFGRGQLPLDRSLDIAIQLADGLSHAHARGIIHRDVKPENVIVTPEGLTKILDFGLAKRTKESLPGPEGASALPTATAPGTVLGTVSYMSPEQARGKRWTPAATSSLSARSSTRCLPESDRSRARAR